MSRPQGPPRVLCAPTAFKGTIGAPEAAAAMARGAGVTGARARVFPVADGGDGTLDVLAGAVGPAATVTTTSVSGPLGEPATARLLWLAGGAVVIELADAAGLRLCAGRTPLPMEASTSGLGDLVRAAAARGAVALLIGLGGSATTDGGAGALSALGFHLHDARGQPIAPGGAGLETLAGIDASDADPRLLGMSMTLLTDSNVPLLGPRGSARMYAPQKGADPSEVGRLDEALARLAAILERDLGAEPGLRDSRGVGAAGGTAYGLAAALGATILPGAAVVCDLVHLDEALTTSDLVLTGEGRLDAQTWTGKAPWEVLGRARTAGVPCIAIAGVVEDGAGFDATEALSGGTSPHRFGPDAADDLAAATTRAVTRWLADS